ncbi:MAG: lipopolysaccharide heptosyltransferase [Solirubrobacterales bacterium]|nr:lipopolysaccharide heptosyltransferase [Solirubrobacterales bacterium]
MSLRPVAIVIRLSALGDVLLCGPAIRELAVKYDVILVTDPAFASLASAMPGISEAIELDRDEGVLGARRLGLVLRSRAPALVVDFQNKVRTRVLTEAIGAPSLQLRRRTTAQAAKAVLGRDTILQNEHQTGRYLKVIAAPTVASLELGPLQLHSAWQLEADRVAATAGWTQASSPIAIAPVATHASKGWPISRYAELAHRLTPRGTPLLLIAGPGPLDREQSRTFREALGDWPQLVDCSPLPLTTIAALIARCRLLVGNDSGPIHLATSLGVPTVAVFGPTSVRRWGPVPGTEVEHRVARLELPCAPCSNHGDERCPLGHHRCMQDLSIAAVEHELSALRLKAFAS